MVGLEGTKPDSSQVKIPLLGPRPSDVFDPIPDEDILSAMQSDVDRLRSDMDSDTRNVILTLARIWNTSATGVIKSKDTAAEWVLQRLPVPHRALLARARAIYLGDLDEGWDDVKEDIAPCVDYLICEIRSIVSVGDEHAPQRQSHNVPAQPRAGGGGWSAICGRWGGRATRENQAVAPFLPDFNLPFISV
jgi:hypothetical protein